MKTIKIISIALFIYLGFFTQENKAIAQPNVDVSFNIFYNALKPYGFWFNYGEFGLCWRPYGVSYSWQPYRDGHWVWTNFGWTWVSDYPWGWAPFHYGRWIYDNYYGWIWVPDYEWAPAWVQWRYGDDYIGWAPLPPRVRFTVTIGVDIDDYGVSYHHWNYIYIRDIVGVRYRYIPRSKIYRVHRYTKNVTNITIINNNIYNYGPRINDIERVTGTRIREYKVVGERELPRNREVYRIDNDNLHIYRPEISRTSGSTRGNNDTRNNATNTRNIEREERNFERINIESTRPKEEERNIDRGTRQDSRNREENISTPTNRTRIEEPRKEERRIERENRIEKPNYKIEERQRENERSNERERRNESRERNR